MAALIKSNISNSLETKGTMMVTLYKYAIKLIKILRSIQAQIKD